MNVGHTTISAMSDRSKITLALLRVTIDNVPIFLTPMAARGYVATAASSRSARRQVTIRGHSVLARDAPVDEIND